MRPLVPGESKERSTKSVLQFPGTSSKRSIMSVLQVLRGNSNQQNIIERKNIGKHWKKPRPIHRNAARLSCPLQRKWKYHVIINKYIYIYIHIHTLRLHGIGCMRNKWFRTKIIKVDEICMTAAWIAVGQPILTQTLLLVELFFFLVWSNPAMFVGSTSFVTVNFPNRIQDLFLIAKPNRCLWRFQFLHTISMFNETGVKPYLSRWKIHMASHEPRTCGPGPTVSTWLVTLPSPPQPPGRTSWLPLLRLPPLHLPSHRQMWCPGVLKEGPQAGNQRPTPYLKPWQNFCSSQVLMWIATTESRIERTFSK